jgi:hypothetical protein
VPTIVKENSCYLDENNFYSNDKTSIIASHDKYLLGLLNSKLLTFYLKELAPRGQGGYYEAKPVYMEKLPIRPIDFKNKDDVKMHDRMVELVTRMLDLNKKLAAVSTPADKEFFKRQIDATDAEIDALVYKLYDLTDEEIQLVEEKN